MHAPRAIDTSALQMQAAEDAAQAVRRDYSSARETVAAMARAGTLGDASVMELAKSGQFEEPSSRSPR